MRGMWAIFKRDVSASIGHPMFYFTAALFGFLNCLFYFQNLMRFMATSGIGARMNQSYSFHQEVVNPHLGISNLLFILIIPVLTMRLLSEEKKNRTYDLLLTSPVTATDIAVGKFLAGLAAASVLVLISALYPLSTMLFADIEKGPLFSSLFGMLLLTGLYVAVGLFCSALTESVVISAVMAIVVNLSLWFFSQWVTQVDSPFWSKVVGQLAMVQQYFSFVEGKIKLSAMAYFVTMISFFVFLCQRVVESSRWR